MRKGYFSTIVFFLLLGFIFPMNFSLFSQQVKVNQKQIDRKRRKEGIKAKKVYEADLKRHHKSQTKETRAMMRESRKKSKRITPLKK
ncbi:MAG: hypothetical protein V1733_01970 [bacterium]